MVGVEGKEFVKAVGAGGAFYSLILKIPERLFGLEKNVMKQKYRLV